MLLELRLPWPICWLRLMLSAWLKCNNLALGPGAGRNSERTFLSLIIRRLVVCIFPLVGVVVIAIRLDEATFDFVQRVMQGQSCLASGLVGGLADVWPTLNCDLACLVCNGNASITTMLCQGETYVPTMSCCSNTHDL